MKELNNFVLGKGLFALVKGHSGNPESLNGRLRSNPPYLEVIFEKFNLN